MARGKTPKMSNFPMYVLITLVAIIAVGAMMSLTAPAVDDKVGACQADGFNTLNVAAKNPLNSSLEYQAGSFVAVVGDDTVDTGTGTAGTSLTHTALDIPCEPRAGIIYALGTADLTSSKGSYALSNGETADYVILLQADSAQAQFKLFDTTLTNTSADFASTQTETTAVAMSAGDTRTGYLDIKVPTGKAQYGGPESAGLLWIIDTVDSASFGNEDISLTSSDITLAKVDCSEYLNAQAQDSANRCYTSKAIKASDGVGRLQWTMTNGGGADAGASSDPIVYVEDLQYFEDTDGTIQYGAFTKGGTNVGETQVKLTWANS